MTDLLSRPGAARRVPGAPATPARPPPPAARALLRATLTGALAAAGTGLVAVAVVVVLAWSGDGRSGASAGVTLRTAGQAWLLAHHVPLALPGGALGLLPAGLTALAAVLLVRAGGGLARALAVVRLRQAVPALLIFAWWYAAVAWAVALACATDTVRPSAAWAVIGPFVLAVAAGGVGLLRAADLLPVLRVALPERARVLAAAAAAAVAVPAVTGALLAVAALAWHTERAGSMISALHPGLVGGFALLLLCLAYFPVAAVWGACYLIGPGFAVGVATGVSPFSVSLGDVPALPLLAALPHSGAPPRIALLALLVPVGAGALAGVRTLRCPAASRRRSALWALAVGPCASAPLALLAWLAGGPAGGGRLAVVGPSPWQVGLAAAAEIGAGAAAAAWLWHGRDGA